VPRTALVVVADGELVAGGTGKMVVTLQARGEFDIRAMVSYG
jgi:hypothetical protein